MTSTGRVSLVTLGCARNEVDSEELAGRLDAAGWELVEDAADVVVVNTCGFVESAKKDSIDTLLAAHDTGAKVVAVGCLAERYGEQLADQLPEADAVLGFDAYAGLPASLADVLAGGRPASHTPGDRRTLLPISPVERAAVVQQRTSSSGPRSPASSTSACPATPAVRPSSGAGSRTAPSRRSSWPPAATGAARSAPSRASAARSSAAGPSDVLAEARWLAEHGVRELVLVSENSTSYGKDLGDLRLLETLLPELTQVPGHRAGAAVLPAAGRDAARPGVRADRHPGRRAVLRHELPALLGVGAAADAALRRHRELPGPARPDPGRRPDRPPSGATSSSASRARPRTTSPSSSAS
jgi:hypothetical protein